MKKLHIRNNPKRFMLAAFVATFGVIGAYLVVTSRAAGDATLSLTPSNQVVNVGTTFTVTIVENSNTTPANALQADLVYDKTKLQFVSTDTSTGAFSIVAQNTGGDGTVFLGAGSTSPLTGQRTVAVVTFMALGTGTTPITFANSSGIAGQVGENVENILGTTTGATVTINDNSAPTVPAGLTMTNRTPTSTSFNWTAATDNVAVTGYRVYRGGTQIGTTTNTTFTDTGLTPSTNYSYTIAAYDAAGNASAQSAPLAITTLPDTTAPSVPTGITLTARTLTSIVFSWTASTDNVGIAGYRVYRNGNQIGTSTTPTFTDSGLSPGTSYAYTVAAYDAAGNASAQSTGSSLTTLADTVAPSVPTGLTSPTQTTTSITLNWAAATDNVAVTGYRIYRNGTQVTTSATTSYTDSGLTPGTSYAYTVAAYDAVGNVSVQSAPASFTPILKTGDANRDGSVNFLDLSIMATSWKSAIDLRADFNNDGIVNYLDLSILATNWEK